MFSDSPRRDEIASHIAVRLRGNLEAMREQYRSPEQVPSCWIDELLPDDLARRIFESFPPVGRMSFKNSIKERKYVSAQMNQHPPLLEETVYAFQDPRVLQLVGEITGLREIEPDADLYAGGISAMPKGNYLKPHLDNSHDKDGQRYRILNLLYYVTPDWREEYGGNLELWDRARRASRGQSPACSIVLC